MLRRKILKKIYFTTLIVFILFVISSFTINKNISNIKVEFHNPLSRIYLLNDDNYLLAVDVLIDDDIMKSIPIIINNLKENNKNYFGLKGIIPFKPLKCLLSSFKLLITTGILSIILSFTTILTSNK